MTDKYLISNVHPSEYAKLKEAKQNIITEFVESFNNDEYRLRARQMNLSFKYNPETFTVGIVKGDEKRLVLNEDEACLDYNEKCIVASLHQNLEDRIGIMRTREGNWID